MAELLVANETDRPNTRDGVTDVEVPLCIEAELKAQVRILLADGEPTLRAATANVLRHEGYDVVVCNRTQEALDTLRHRAFDIVLADLELPQVPGLTLLKAAFATNPDTIGIVMTDNPSMNSCVEALAQGAWEYLPKPFSAAQLQITIGRATLMLAARREACGRPATVKRRNGQCEQIVLLGNAPGFRAAIEVARKVAPTDAPVLITGESGSGKDLIAQFIHRESRRANHPYVPLNCAALPDALLESEMFGHRKGAFTGADREKAGLLEAANGGTLFLDELLEMPKASQAKLLRVIQDGVVRRVGSETADTVVNVRFLAATNGDVDTAVRARELREDLYYRLGVVHIPLPPLRERGEDIPILAQYLLETSWTHHRPKGAPCPTLTPGAIHALRQHPWPGNVRELRNVIERSAVIVEPGAEIRPSDLHLSPDTRAVVPTIAPSALPPDIFDGSYHQTRDQYIAQFEREYLTRLVDATKGNMVRAARTAGVDRSTLYRMMERQGLHRSLKARSIEPREPQVEPSAPVEEEPVGCHYVAVEAL